MKEAVIYEQRQYSVRSQMSQHPANHERLSCEMKIVIGSIQIPQLSTNAGCLISEFFSQKMWTLCLQKCKQQASDLWVICLALITRCKER